MISQSNLDVLETLRRFKKAHIPVAFLVPTPTAMDKSIIDATKGVRVLFKDSGLHDYDSQLQGPENKIYIETTVFSLGKIESTKASLYRPETKNGDPRICIYGLKKLADATDLLALIVVDNNLMIINCSKSDLEHVLSSKTEEALVAFRQAKDINPELFQANNNLGTTLKKIDKSEPLSEILSSSVEEVSDVALELLGKLRKVYEMGYINTIRAGDTGVGYTLETLLGIKANSSQAPDYKGIELKSGRSRSHKSGRTTIFSQVPNWKISRLKGSKELLQDRGRYNETKKRLQLFHELSLIKANSFNLQLRVDEGLDQLTQIYTGAIPPVVDVRWDFGMLVERLISKHKETFWVTAETLGKNKDLDEKFFYSKLKHTGGVDSSAFMVLLELGVITLDYTIKESPTGAVKDHGYLFKIAHKNLDLLFKRVDEYDFSQPAN